MADLLASSIHFVHARRNDVRLVIGVPEDAPVGLTLRERPWAELADFVSLPAPTLLDTRKQQPYRHFNKILLLEKASQQWSSSHHLLLDSDLVLLRHLPLTYLACHKIAAMPVHYYGWHGNWDQLYAEAGIQPDYLTISSSGYAVGPAYFNAGVVWVHQHLASSLGWSAMALHIHAAHHHDPAMHLFPWLDQLALPLAATAQGVRIHELPDCLNMLCDKLSAMDELVRQGITLNYLPKTPFLVHHHGNVSDLARVVERINPPLFQHQPWQQALQTLLDLSRKGIIRRNRAVHRRSLSSG
uniref:hypothetical protein n=1 Tax=Synechococcus sp. CS-1329 TaxID=2847975 RepID=UPI00223ACF09|nr:hypothetical protein [Synechococcus sp. CS-1329]